MRQSELALLAEFEARYFAALRAMAERVTAGVVIEHGPLMVDDKALAARPWSRPSIIPSNNGSNGDSLRPE